MAEMILHADLELPFDLESLGKGGIWVFRVWVRNERGRAGARSELGEGEGVVGEREGSGLNVVGPNR